MVQLVGISHSNWTMNTSPHEPLHFMESVSYNEGIFLVSAGLLWWRVAGVKFPTKDRSSHRCKFVCKICTQLSVDLCEKITWPLFNMRSTIWQQSCNTCLFSAHGRRHIAYSYYWATLLSYLWNNRTLYKSNLKYKWRFTITVLCVLV